MLALTAIPLKTSGGGGHKRTGPGVGVGLPNQGTGGVSKLWNSPYVQIVCELHVRVVTSTFHGIAVSFQRGW